MKGRFPNVQTGGNTKVTSLAAKNQVKYQFTDKVLGTWKLGAIYGKNDDVKTAENYFTDLKVDYLFTERFYSFVNAGWLKNKFAGIDQRLYGGLGAGYKFLNGPAHFLVGELGLNYVSDQYTDNTTKDYPGGAASANTPTRLRKRTGFPNPWSICTISTTRRNTK